MSAAPAGANVSQTETNPWPIIETNFLPPPPNQFLYFFISFEKKKVKIKLNIFLFNATKKEEEMSSTITKSKYSPP